MVINNVPGVRTDITEMLSKLREVSSKSKVFTDHNAPSSVGNFNEVLSLAKDSVANISTLQNHSEALKTSYVTGDGNVSMSEVVLASQKSKLAFEGLMSVRNKILEAYKEIMNMPI